jgi:hypothetical protein
VIRVFSTGLRMTAYAGGRPASEPATRERSEKEALQSLGEFSFVCLRARRTQLLLETAAQLRQQSIGLGGPYLPGATTPEILREGEPGRRPPGIFRRVRAVEKRGPEQRPRKGCVILRMRSVQPALGYAVLQL